MRGLAAARGGRIRIAAALSVSPIGLHVRAGVTADGSWSASFTGRRTTNGPEAAPTGGERLRAVVSCGRAGYPPMPSRSNAHPSGSVTSSNRRPLSG